MHDIIWGYERTILYRNDDIAFFLSHFRDTSLIKGGT